MTVFFDWETRSKCDLIARGAGNYVADPSTEVLCFAAVIPHDIAPWRILIWHPFGEITVPAMFVQWPGADKTQEFEPPRVFCGEAAFAQVIDQVRRAAPIAAHNAHGFDRNVWDTLGLGEVDWIDTLDLARRRILPGKLDAIGKHLYGQGKSAGRAAMMHLSIPNKKTREFNAPNDQTLGACIQYCLDDVLLMASAYYDEMVGDVMPAWEQRLLEVNTQINRRGFAFDAELAKALLLVERDLRAREAAVARRVSDGAVTSNTLSSNKQLLAWLKSVGYRLPDVQNGTVMAVIKHPDCSPVVRTVLWARLGAMRVAPGKLVKGITTRDPDGRLRHQFAYCSAHTGRWGGRGVNPQNLPRPDEDIDLTVAVQAAQRPAAVAEAAALAAKPIDDVLSSLLRCTIVPTKGRLLAIADYAAVEGRGVCWAASDEEGLNTYRQGLDPYVVQAATLYGRGYAEIKAEKDAGELPGKLQRQVGKQIVLGCGYQMGWERFAGTCTDNGVDLGAAGVSPGECVEAFRDLHPAIAGVNTNRMWNDIVLRSGGLWKMLQKGVMEVVEGKHPDGLIIGKCGWFMQGPDLRCVLPSQRPLLYRNARVEPMVPSWGGDPRPTVCYDKVLGSTVIRTHGYGGKWCENLVQALCRDLMGLALVRLADAGFDTIAHIHDEIVVEIDRPEQLEEVVAMMCEPPAWAAGFPIAVEGHAADRYYKEAPEGAPKAKASQELEACRH